MKITVSVGGLAELVLAPPLHGGDNGSNPLSSTYAGVAEQMGSTTIRRA